MEISEVLLVTQQLIDSDQVDFVDLSLWDCFKEPEDAAHQGSTLIEVATAVERRTTPSGRRVPLGVAGKLHNPADIEKALPCDGKDRSVETSPLALQSPSGNVDYRNVTKPETQASMTDAATAPVLPAIGLPVAVDVSSIKLPQ